MLELLARAFVPGCYQCNTLPLPHPTFHTLRTPSLARRVGELDIANTVRVVDIRTTWQELVAVDLAAAAGREAGWDGRDGGASPLGRGGDGVHRRARGCGPWR